MNEEGDLIEAPNMTLMDLGGEPDGNEMADGGAVDGIQ